MKIEINIEKYIDYLNREIEQKDLLIDKQQKIVSQYDFKGNNLELINENKELKSSLENIVDELDELKIKHNKLEINYYDMEKDRNRMYEYHLEKIELLEQQLKESKETNDILREDLKLLESDSKKKCCKIHKKK